MLQQPSLQIKKLFQTSANSSSECGKHVLEAHLKHHPKSDTSACTSRGEAWTHQMLMRLSTTLQPVQQEPSAEHTFEPEAPQLMPEQQRSIVQSRVASFQHSVNTQNMQHEKHQTDLNHQQHQQRQQQQDNISEQQYHHESVSQAGSASAAAHSIGSSLALRLAAKKRQVAAAQLALLQAELEEKEARASQSRISRHSRQARDQRSVESCLEPEAPNFQQQRQQQTSSPISHLVLPSTIADFHNSGQGRSAQGRSAAETAPSHTPALMMNMPVSNPFGRAVASRQDEARSLDLPAAHHHEAEASGIPSHENPNRVTLQPAIQTQNFVSHNLPSAAACPEQSGPVFDPIATDGHFSRAAGPFQPNNTNARQQPDGIICLIFRSLPKSRSITMKKSFNKSQLDDNIRQLRHPGLSVHRRAFCPPPGITPNLLTYSTKFSRVSATLSNRALSPLNKPFSIRNFRSGRAPRD